MSRRGTSHHQHFTRQKRNEEVDRNRGRELAQNFNPEFQPRRDRETIRGRRDSSVLPLTCKPLYGFDETEQQTMSSESQDAFRAEIQAFSVGSGEALATGQQETGGQASVPQFGHQDPQQSLNNDLNRNSSGAIRKTPPSVQNNILLEPAAQVPTAPTPTLDRPTIDLMREMILASQKEMMSDIMTNLTQEFKESLKIETEKIVRQISSENTSSHPKRSQNNPQYGPPSNFFLGYREPTYSQNETHPGAYQPQNSRPNSSPAPQNSHPAHSAQGLFGAFQPPQQFQPSQHFQNRQPPQPNQNANAIQIQLDKWGFQFNGTNMSVDDFLFRIECKQATSNYSWQQVYSNLNNILSGPAESWYWSFRRNHPRADYASFRIALSERYPSKDNDIDLWRKLINRKMRFGESFDDFVDDIERIFYKMEDRPTELQLINVIRDNVTVDLSAYIGLARTNTLAGIKLLGREAEKLVEKLNPGRSKSYKKNVHEVSNDGPCATEEDHAFIEAFSGPRKEYKIFQCKRCKQKFRVDEETQEEKKVYCYGCGKEGVIVSKCPVCAENRKGSE